MYNIKNYTILIKTLLQVDKNSTPKPTSNRPGNTNKYTNTHRTLKQTHVVIGGPGSSCLQNVSFLN